MHEGRLYCAHSHYPGVPNLRSVEIWDTATVKHVGSRSFGRANGSFTWLDRRNGRWVACFVHYGGKGGEPRRSPEWTGLVEFDDKWRQTGGWASPDDLIKKLAVRGFSVSGGAFGPGGFLFVTGHDDTALYVLVMPEAGPALKGVATIPISAQDTRPSVGIHVTPACCTRLAKLGAKSSSVVSRANRKRQPRTPALIAANLPSPRLRWGAPRAVSCSRR